MPPRPFRFGIQLGSAQSRREWCAAAVRAEALGYDVLLMPDHYGDYGGQLSPFPALATAAAATSTLRVGTLDLLSDGRLELGIGAGWDASDYTETGIAFDLGGVRVDRLEEALQLLKRAWLGEPFSFSGSHYDVSGYRGQPLPAQRPHPPLLIGSGAPRLLGIAAREADIIAFCPRPTPDGAGLIWADLSAAAMERKLGWVRDAAGDRFASLELNCNVFAIEVTDDAFGAIERLAAEFGCAAAELRDSPHVWVGSVEEIVDRLLERRSVFGLSYYAILGDLELLEVAAPIVARLAGS